MADQLRYVADIKTAGKITAATTVLKGTIEKQGVSGSTVSVQLKDIANHWGKDSIEYLVARGGVAGFPDGTFRPNQTISKAEFLKIALYSSAIVAKTPSDGTHWASGVFADALNLGVLKEGELPKGTWDDPITRYEMTMIMARISQDVLKESVVGTGGISNIMEDYDTVQQQSYYVSYVEQAFMKGLIAGSNSAGKFNGSANGTRAEAATMVVRLIDTSKRVKVDTSRKLYVYRNVAPKEAIDNYIKYHIRLMRISSSDEYMTETVIKKVTNEINNDLNKYLPAYKVWREPTTLRWDDPSRDHAMIGDIFIKEDGTKVVLKVGPNGVLGEGQGVALDIGRSNGVSTVYDGFQARNNDYGPYAGQVYTINPHTGEGHWSIDWVKIINNTYPTYNGTKVGELSKDKNWEWTSVMGGTWKFVIRTSI